MTETSRPASTAEPMPDLSQAHEHLETATTMYREMDMRLWLEQAEAEMAALR